MSWPKRRPTPTATKRYIFYTMRRFRTQDHTIHTTTSNHYETNSPGQHRKHINRTTKMRRDNVGGTSFQREEKWTPGVVLNSASQREAKRGQSTNRKGEMSCVTIGTNRVTIGTNKLSGPSDAVSKTTPRKVGPRLTFLWGGPVHRK